MAEPWRIKGEYLENCNCEVLCPCLLGPRNARGGAAARPTEGHCDVPLVFRIDSGQYGPTNLAGTHAANIIYTPGAMGDGNWTVGTYVDERASAAQRAGLEAIFTGQAGGIMSALGALVTTRLPTKVAPIEFGMEGTRRWARIPGVLDVTIEGIPGAQPGSEAWIDNVRHPVAGRLAAARATRSSYRDHGFDWNNTGRNGHYAGFEWSGP
jgi:hypothetical protein